MALTRAANEPNQVLQTPYFTLGSTLIPLGGSTSTISGNLTFNGNLTLNGPIVINSSTNGVALYVVKQDIWSNGFSVNKRGNFTDPNGAVVNSTELGYNGFYGWDGTAYGRGAYMFAVSEQNFSPGNHGARLTFHTTSVGSDDATERLRISSDGSIKFSGQVAETATISATSANTIDIYTVTIIKTATSTYTVIEQLTKAA